MGFIRSNIALILALAVFVLALFFVYDILFSPPDHLQGELIEKIHVPKRNTMATPYAGALRSNYFISAQNDEQWIAIVKTNAGDTLVVHCKSNQYQSTNVGDIIHFKKYEGTHFHIKYFAHNEEEQ